MDADPTRYLTPADIYAIAEDVLGRKPDVRDRHLLRSAAKRPMLHYFGEDAYPTLLDKAAALLHSLAAHHLFFDGNKRTAARVTTVFLRANGLEPTWDAADAYRFILEVAQNKHDVPDIARWLAANTRPIQQS
jgi:death-on-curing protein